VLDDTRQHALTRDGLSAQLSGTVQHDPARDGRPFQTTQIYEGTNQIQRMVIAKQLFS
jgi:alkylation response protein AidB-like acyl-CoA dehydrogenase